MDSNIGIKVHNLDSNIRQICRASREPDYNKNRTAKARILLLYMTQGSE